ncbi:MAG TPA: hypothetical protein VFW98_10825 [Gemmatimonadaceae bacterium]|nr:hypothetical protein [Gemmatimonadaceae bacterium]
MKRWVPVVLAMGLAACTASAEAQFTAAVIPPHTPRAQAPPPLVTRVDSELPPAPPALPTMAGMKAWVDSAAQALAAPPTADTAQSPARPAPPVGSSAAHARPAAPTPGKTTRFRNGAPAPATASPLPLLAVLGMASIIAGALLRRRAR